MDFVAIDFETANEQATSACELGVSVVVNYSVIKTDSWLIRPPELRFNPYNTRLHGIAVEHVEGERPFGELWEMLLPYFENNLIVAHNAAFDMDVMRQLLLLYGIPFLKFDYLCSIRLAKRVWKDEYRRYGLRSLSQAFGIELDHHHAASDANACALIASRAFREMQVSCREEIESKLNLHPGSITPQQMTVPRKKPNHSRTEKYSWLHRFRS